LSIALITALAAATASVEFPVTRTYRLTDQPPPTIDGRVEDAEWANTTLITDFHQIKPGDHAPPSERTEVRLAYDNDFFYIGIKAYDGTPDAITANGLIQGRTFFSDDRFEVHLDTFNDRRNAYFFQVNANGIRREALIGNDYWIEEWDTVWFADGRRQPWGWSAEMAIPFNSISFDPTLDTWGLNLSRVIPRKNEEVSWSSRERNINPAVSGYASGLDGMRQGHGIELVPSATVSVSDRRVGKDDTRFDPSLTGFYKFTPFLTGALTFNTDFSATEADERQINLSRFSLFFPEKREFFLQDASIFEFGGLARNGRPFFSRRIGLSSSGEPLDIDAGAKLTGRAGDWNIGALAIHQDAGAPDSDQNLLVARVSRNLLRESSLGLIYTQGDPDSSARNRVAGVDFNYRNSNIGDGRTLVTRLWAQRSDTDGVHGRDRAWGAALDWPNDRIDGELAFSRIEENFNPALGFVNRRGVNEVDGQVRFRLRPDSGSLQWMATRLQYFRAERIDTGDVDTQAMWWNFFEASTQGSDFITFFVGRQTENLLEPFEISPGVIVPPGRYDGDRYGFYVETGQHRPLSLVMEIVDGGFLSGDNLAVIPELTWRPGPRLELSVAMELNNVDLPQGDVTTRLYRLRANIAFNARWAWLNLVQTDNVSDTISVNSRLRWEPRADRELFLVLNQVAERSGWRAFETEFVFRAEFNFRY